MGLGSDVLRKRDREPRLANARFAGNRHHPTFTALRLLPAADNSSTSSSRPTSGVSPERSASNRLTSSLAPNIRQAYCGSAKPESCCGPRSSRSNSPPICRRVASPMWQPISAAMPGAPAVPDRSRSWPSVTAWVWPAALTERRQRRRRSKRRPRRDQRRTRR